MRRLHAGALTCSLATTILVTGTLVAFALVSPEPPSPSGVTYLLGFLTMALAGCLLAGFRPGHPIAWVFVLGGNGTLLAAGLKGLAVGDDLGANASGWLAALSLLLFGMCWIAVTTLPLLLFPSGRPEGRVARAGVALVALLGVAVAAAVVVGAQPDEELPPSPVAIPGWESASSQIVDLAILLSAAVTVVAAVTLATRWRRSAGLQRRQLAWLGVAALVMASLLVVSILGASFAPGFPEVVGAAVEAAEIAVFPLAMLAAILDARLFDIDVVFRRSLVYAVLVGLVVAAYAIAITLASAVLGTLVASVVVALALTPVRDWLAWRVESLLYGSRRRPAEVMALVAEQAVRDRSVGDTGATLGAAAEALGVGMRLGSVRIRLDGEPPTEAAWSAPRRQPSSSAVPVVLRLTALGAAEGQLEVTPDAGDSLTEADVTLLRQLAPQIGLIAHAVRAAARVQQSREQIVGAREAERLRLRRDLHDGLGPALVGLALQVEAVGACLDTDPRRAAELNARVAIGLRSVIEEMRAAVDGLRPADLDQLGLAGALQEQARSMSAGGIDVEVTCQTLEVSPAAEVAAYRIATEGLANVVRHAGARQCRVTVGCTGTDVVVRVEDDGLGYDDVGTPTPGVGLDSMRARAEEIGGRLTIGPREPSGTVVEAVLPAGSPTTTAAPGTMPEVVAR